MFRNNHRRALVVGIAILTITSGVLISMSIASTGTKTTKLTGHVLGFVGNILKYNGDGGNLLTFAFILDADKKEDLPASIVSVEYVWFSDEIELPPAFFDYSKHYEVEVSRNSKRDTTVGQLFYLQVHNSGKSEKAPERIYIFQLSEGAPKMNLSDDLVLPCYGMTPGNYSLVK